MTVTEPLDILVMAPQPFYQNRGTPIAVRLLAGELARLGHRVDLLVFHEGDDIDIEGVVIHRIPSLPGVRNIPPSISWKKLFCDGVMLIKALSLVRRRRYAIIHAVEEAAFLAIILKALCKTDYIYDMDSSLVIQIVDKLAFLRPLQPVMAFFERKAVQQSCGVVAVCQALVEIAQQYDPTKKVALLEDISLLEDGEPTSESLRQHYGIDGPIMLYVGNLEGYQGIDLLLESFQLARERGARGNVVIIGGTPETIDQYRRKARQLGIDRHTYFCGPRPVAQLGGYLEQADILLSPRIQGNNTPMKLYSYLDSGKAVLATNLSTHTQVLSDDFACLVAPCKEAMAEGMERLLGDAQMCLTLGAKGRKIARDNYSLASFQQKLNNFYTGVAGDLIAKRDN